jgi:hypothetical protein
VGVLERAVEGTDEVHAEVRSVRVVAYTLA